MSSAPLHPDHGNLRVSDADRDLVTQVLNTAFAEGRITHDELDERMDQVLVSKTFNDLQPITADLMPSRPTQQCVTRPAQHGSDVVVVDPHADDGTETVTAVLSSSKRESGWRMKSRNNVSAVLGDVKLDLNDGVMEAHTCEINLQVYLGEVKLFVPDGVIVIDRTTSVMGDIGIKGLRPAAVGSPTIILKGVVFMGDVKVYGPDHVSLGKRLGISKR